MQPTFARNRLLRSWVERMPGRVVIVGASLGGLRTLEALAAAGIDPALVTIVGEEAHRPYNRPPLSKELLVALSNGTDLGAAFERAAFRVKPELEAAEWRLGVAATAASLNDQRITLSDGSELTYDALVVATGLTPRRMSIPGGEEDRFVVRTLEDSMALGARLQPGVKVVVIGGGFIGCETAATANKLGCEATIVEPMAAPMERAIGPEIGTAMRYLHEAKGVAFRLGVAVKGWRIDDGGKLTGVKLDSGEVLDTDVVIEAIGSVVNISWLEGQGLDLSNGLLCDNWLRVEGRPELYAIGDVARFPNPILDQTPRRVEHWCIPGFTAKRTADALAAHLRGEVPDPNPFKPMPSFWSDQHGVRIQSFGSPALGDAIEVLEGDYETPEAVNAGVAIGYRRAGAPIGIVTIGLPPGKAFRHRSYLDGANQ